MNARPVKPPARWQVYAGINEDTGEWLHVKVGPTGPADEHAKRVKVRIAGRPPARWVAEFDHEPTPADIATLNPTLPILVEV